MGAVDAGKTTFVKLYSEKVEKYGRTEALSLLNAKIGDSEVQFVDCPGHSALSHSKNLGVSISDVVFYVVDSTRVKLPLLEQIVKIKPVILLLNRWTSPLDLKDHFKDPSLRNKLYSQMMDKIPSRLGLEVLPFFDSEARPDCFMFPVNFVTRWGVKEFQTYLLNHWLKSLSLDHREFLYLVGDRPHHKYAATRNSQLIKINLNGEYAPVSKFFSYNPKQTTFTLRPGFKEKFSPLYKIDDPNTSASEIVELPPEDSVSEELRDLLERVKPLDLKFCVYGDEPHKMDCLSRFSRESGLSVLELKHLTFKQYEALELENTIRLAWVSEQRIDYEGGLVCSDSFYCLMDHLSCCLRSRLKTHRDRVLEDLNQEYVASIQPEYVFKHTKKKTVAGVRLLFGRLKEDSSFILRDYSRSLRGSVKKMEYEGTHKSIWTNPEQNVGVEFQFEEPWDPSVGPLLFYSSSLLDKLDLYENSPEVEIKKTCDTIRSHLSSSFRGPLR